MDELGRIVLPIEWRRVLEIQEKDSMEFFIDPDSSWIMVRKYQSQACMFCQTMDNLVYYHEKFICPSCIHELRLQAALKPGASPATLEADEDALTLSSEGMLLGHPSKDTATRKRGRKRGKRGEAYERLLEAMRKYPNGTQNEWARLIGISQSRVSQILREIRQSDPTMKTRKKDGQTQKAPPYKGRSHSYD
ncbi:AbrB/MazE/SpoVT family DNA-binding domain-containing protein [uncultured Paenibacillus sp.]|uniref:AbrB/MazE/SpoVT family DNA-binding domain-containing protein n=1 Tax=uncultured Paenibacillus sp. TaxID=227322 RepID=UPI002805B2EC|nr:AbrB/MazE/SpoVT family DNA-binding domain-containing protein [uncultured Paenibacillus sp.]